MTKSFLVAGPVWRLIVLLSVLSMAQASGAADVPTAQAPAKPAIPAVGEYTHELDTLKRKINTVLLMQRFGDIAVVDEVRYTSLPARQENETAAGAGNPLIISASPSCRRDSARAGRH